MLLDKLLPILFILCLVYAWYEIMRVRELVIEHCKRLCHEANLQLLDQTVALASLSIKRVKGSGIKLQRLYKFEVSDNGVDRLSGFITVLGSRIVESRLEGADGINIFHLPRSSTLH